MGREGDWVEIHFVVLGAGERATSIPEDTAEVPLEARVKGFLTGDARVGDEVEIRTVLGRRLRGELVRVRPAATHTFATPAPELLPVGADLRGRLDPEARGA